VATTLLQYRNKVRNNLDDWPEQDALNDATNVTTTDTTFAVDTGSKFHVGQFCQIGDECFLVSADPSTNDLTVVRGQKGTTAAIHLDNAVIWIDPHWLNTEYNEAINECHAQVLEKKVYDDFSLFSQSKVISHFESTETWGGSGDADTSVFRTGKQGLRIVSSGTKVEDYRTGTFDLKGLESDKIDLFVYVDEADNLSTLTLKFHQTLDTALFSYAITGLKDGWNSVSIDRDDFTDTGSADWRQIIRIEFEVTAAASTVVNVIFDSLRLRTTQEHILIYDLPSDLVKLLDVYVYKSDHKAKRPFRRWGINRNAGTSGVDQLQLNVPISSGYKIGLRYIAGFAELSTDIAETTLPTKAKNLPVYWACHSLLTQKTGPRARYDRASSKLDEEANPAWLPERTATYWFNKFESERKRCGMARNHVRYRTIEDY